MLCSSGTKDDYSPDQLLPDSKDLHTHNVLQQDEVWPHFDILASSPFWLSFFSDTKPFFAFAAVAEEITSQREGSLPQRERPHDEMP